MNSIRNEGTQNGIPEVFLLFVGDGELLGYNKALGKELGIDEFIKFSGNVSDVYKYYNAMDVLAVPSINEGLPMAAVEAQANGLACILSEGVPKETQICEDVIFFPLEVENWSDCIISISKRNSLLYRR